jgi:2Fe-2S ferredoxin
MNFGNREDVNDILITVIWDEVTYEIVTFANEYRNLMMLIFDRVSPEDFGECLGMGKCGTCLVEVIKGYNLTDFDRNESNTLNKIGVDNLGMRLACQLMIDQYCDGMIVRIV